MDEEYDDTELGRIADERIQSFQADSSQVKESCFGCLPHHHHHYDHNIIMVIKTEVIKGVFDPRNYKVSSCNLF